MTTISKAKKLYPTINFPETRPEGWLEIQRRSKAHAWAIDNHSEFYTILEVQYLVKSQSRWGKTYAGYKYYYVAHPKTFKKIEKDYQKVLDKDKKISDKDKKNHPEKYKKIEEHKKLLSLQNKASKEKMNFILSSMGLDKNKYTEMLYDNLDDITTANTEWLARAEEALTYSIENKGILYDWLHNRVEDDFYCCLCLAMNAHYRHTQTDYESLLTQGISKEFARELIRS